MLHRAVKQAEPEKPALARQLVKERPKAIGAGKK
jgi:hypothetical protein